MVFRLNCLNHLSTSRAISLESVTIAPFSLFLSFLLALSFLVIPSALRAQGSYGSWKASTCYSALDVSTKRDYYDDKLKKYKWFVRFRNRYGYTIMFNTAAVPSSQMSGTTISRFEIRSGGVDDTWFFVADGGSINVLIDGVKFEIPNMVGYAGCDQDGRPNIKLATPKTATNEKSPSGTNGAPSMSTGTPGRSSSGGQAGQTTPPGSSGYGNTNAGNGYGQQQSNPTKQQAQTNEAARQQAAAAAAERQQREYQAKLEQEQYLRQRKQDQIDMRASTNLAIQQIGSGIQEIVNERMLSDFGSDVNVDKNRYISNPMYDEISTFEGERKKAEAKNLNGKTASLDDFSIEVSSFPPMPPEPIKTFPPSNYMDSKTFDRYKSQNNITEKQLRDNGVRITRPQPRIIIQYRLPPMSTEMIKYYMDEQDRSRKRNFDLRMKLYKRGIYRNRTGTPGVRG